MRKLLFLSILLFTFSCQSIFAQADEETKVEKTPKAVLYDEFPKKLNSEERSAKIDALLVELQNNPNSKAVVLFYCGKECYYGEFEAHVRGITMMKLKPRNVPTNRFVFIYGGYWKESSIQIWLVPDGADLPLPESTIKFEDVKFKGKFKSKMIAYDCCE